MMQCDLLSRGAVQDAPRVLRLVETFVLYTRAKGPQFSEGSFD